MTKMQVLYWLWLAVCAAIALTLFLGMIDRHRSEYEDCLAYGYPRIERGWKAYCASDLSAVSLERIRQLLKEERAASAPILRFERTDDDRAF